MAELKRIKTLKVISLETGFSISKISRLVSFSKLDNSIKKNVIDGQLSFENSIKKSKKPKSAISTLSKNDFRLLELLSFKKWIISEQVAQYEAISVSEARKRLNRLVSFNYVDKFVEVQPYAYRLSHKGAARLDVSIPKHYMSGSAIHQNILKNDVELFYKKTNANFRLISRTKCWDLGLFPAHAEYLISDGKENILVLIDDYQMRPSRIDKSLTRVHDKNGKVLNKPFKISWMEFVGKCHVFTTDKNRMKFFKRYLSKNNFLIPVEVENITPRWETF
jgi:hypothetical protein